MSQEKHITGLLTGFISGTLTSNEKSELYQYLTSDGHQDEMMAWLQEQWSKGHCQVDEEISSDAMFAKIRAEIEKHPSTRSQKPSGRKIHIHLKSKIENNKWKMLLRYAAVLMIAFGLSWVVQKSLTKPGDAGVTEISLQYNEIYVPHGSKTKVTLPDSSTVWLNAGASLKYPVNFNGNIRQVFLQGEGFFDVTKDSQRPFIVSSDGLKIKVLGTKFNVMAYTDDTFMETTLIEGAIEIQGLKDNTGKQSNLRMSPGQKLTARRDNQQYKFQNVQKVALSIDWMENRLVFAKERFGDVKIKLERWYGVTIEVRDPEIQDYLLTGTFENQSVEQAMSALSTAASFTYKMNNNHITVSK